MGGVAREDTRTELRPVGTELVVDGLTPAGQAAVRPFAITFEGPDAGRRITGLAGVLAARGLRADAARLCRYATDLTDEPEVRVRARLVRSVGVPGWHRGLLHDPARAEAYDRAIRRAVEPGSLVLDIGTGSGLLAMMAARAGAGLVVACERDQVLAQVAAEIVVRNGLSEQVRVVACDSRDLRVGVDLPRRADLVISEIVSNDLVAERALETLGDARRRLLREDAAAIPHRGAVHGALVAHEAKRRAPIGELAGFDLSPFNAVTAPFTVLGSWHGVTVMSPVTTFFPFDLSGNGAVHQRHTTRDLEVVRPGRVDGIVQWMSIDLGDDERLDTGPGTTVTSWGRHLHPLERPLDVVEGQVVTVEAWHNQHELLLWERRSPR